MDNINNTEINNNDVPGSSLMGLIRTFLNQSGPVHNVDGYLYRFSQGVYRPISDIALQVLVHAFLEKIADETDNGSVTARDVKSFIAKLEMCKEVFIPDTRILNPHKHIVNMSNTMFNIITGETHKHSPGYMSTVQLPFAYDPNAECPRFQQFLKEILPNDPGAIQFLQEFVGYCIVTDSRHQIFVIFIGNGGNGKSVLANVIKYVVGVANCSFLSITDLRSKFRVHMLRDKFLNIGTENESKIIRDTRMLKQVVSGDEEIIGEMKFKNAAAFQPFVKLLFLTNHTLKFQDNSDGLRRRLRTIQFTEKFSGDKRDLNLSDKLLEELPGIFNWAIEGYRRLQERGHFIETPAMKAQADSIIENSSSVLMFVNSECVVGDLSRHMTRNELYAAYEEFCRIEKQPVLGRRQFLEDLCRFFPTIQTNDRQVRINGQRHRLVYGIEMKIPVQQ